MAPTRRQRDQSAVTRIPKRSSSSVGKILSPPPKTPYPTMSPKSPSTFRIPKKSDSLLPPPSIGASKSCLNVQILYSQEDEYVPEPICEDFPDPMAYQPTPIVPRPSAPTPPMTRARASRSTVDSKMSSLPSVKKSRPPTPVASKATPTVAPKELVPSSGSATPNPVKSILKKRSKYSPETEKLPLKLEETPKPAKNEIHEARTPSRSKTPKDEVPETIERENKRNKVRSSSSSMYINQKKPESSTPPPIRSPLRDSFPETIEREKKKNKTRSSSSSMSISQKKPESSTPPSISSPPRELPTISKIPRLFNLCERQILAYETQIYDSSTDVHVPFNLLRPLLEQYSADGLFETEITMPWLESGIESIWRKRLARDFPSSRLYPLETYGEAYRRCLVECEDS